VGKIAEITSLTEDFRRHSPFALLGGSSFMACMLNWVSFDFRPRGAALSVHAVYGEDLETVFFFLETVEVTAAGFSGGIVGRSEVEKLFQVEFMNPVILFPHHDQDVQRCCIINGRPDGVRLGDIYEK
jgi:hypothetical protein